jgi:hypothetical protein
VAKYDPLFEHLCRCADGPVVLEFGEIARMVGGLPTSAERLGSWWANEAGGGHVQAHAWLNAGREVVAVDRTRRTVTFSAASWRRGA